MLTTLDDFFVIDTADETTESLDPPLDEEDPQQDELEELAKLAEPLINSGATKGKAKYYDDVGFRKPIIDE